ncbi:hypothetical protein KDA_64870 [Dictyobacter alpinus]|uniref:Methyltransferase domain-containing protein n=1 Tax=Dictyobacter alpinus TaxID=2014873 RepID=A0A402BI06_9CHLR|nr:class I SAM-dependent methyltransferase [Dictyobacter alpinus]GCE31003.1 hypothetical protein KDA_64870 [Dictyobacter alpinus]
MLRKSRYFAPKHAESFKDQSIAEAYHYRPPYPAETFVSLEGLVKETPRRVLDAGCGIGYIARNLVDVVDHIDAVDFSQAMITEGQSHPNGNHPNIRWLHGPMETVELEPPYGLITAGESVHWMDWEIVFPRFQQLLVPEGYLVIMKHNTVPDEWDLLSTIIPRYTTNKDYQSFDMIEELEQVNLFKKVGEKTTVSMLYPQSIEDYIASYHSRSGFSCERMGLEQAAAFDQEAEDILRKLYPDGIVSLQIAANIIWGLPGKRGGHFSTALF